MAKKLNKLKLPFLLYPIFASFLSFLFEASTFVSTLIFLGAPSLILSITNKNLIKKSALFSAILVVPLYVIVDYVAGTNGAWFVPKSILSFRLLNVLTLENLLWGFLYVYFVVMYYEYFLNNKSRDELYYPNMKYLVFGGLISLFIFLMLLAIIPSSLNIKYFYLKIGLILIILPIILVLIKFPNLSTKFFKTGVYFFYFSFIYEITALKLEQWTFPGNQFIGFISIFGAKFPFEEFFFWIMLAAISVLSFYEFFDNDRK